MKSVISLQIQDAPAICEANYRLSARRLTIVFEERGVHQREVNGVSLFLSLFLPPMFHSAALDCLEESTSGQWSAILLSSIKPVAYRYPRISIEVWSYHTNSHISLGREEWGRAHVGTAGSDPHKEHQSCEEPGQLVVAAGKWAVGWIVEPEGGKAVWWDSMREGNEG